MLWVVVIFIIALLIWFALAGRRWLKAQPWAQGFFTAIEPVEIALYKKSETLLIGRLTWVGAGIVTLYDTFALMMTGLDLTPITSRVLSFVPEDLRGIVVTAGLGFIGLVISWLRKRVAKPIELVAAPTTPETVEVEAKVDAANAEAVVVADAATKAA